MNIKVNFGKLIVIADDGAMVRFCVSLVHHLMIATFVGAMTTFTRQKFSFFGSVWKCF